MSTFLPVWQILESLVEAGKLKNIGVSNFSAKKLSQARVHTRYLALARQCCVLLPLPSLFTSC